MDAVAAATVVVMVVKIIVQNVGISVVRTVVIVVYRIFAAKHYFIVNSVHLEVLYGTYLVFL